MGGWFIGSVLSTTLWVHGGMLLLSSIYASSTIERFTAVGTAAAMVAAGCWVKLAGAAFLEDRPDLEGSRLRDQVRSRLGAATCTFAGHRPTLMTTISYSLTHNGTVREDGRSHDVHCGRCLIPIGD